MSHEILEFSNLIDQQFDSLDEPTGGFFSFLFRLFR